MTVICNQVDHGQFLAANNVQPSFIMSTSFDIWKMLTGVAFFLLAMNFMENALQRLAGRKFKLFLKKHTTSKIKAIGSGTIITGVLQSSSVVNLMLLSMVGAGVVKMENTLALMLGSNLGTTLNSWILVYLGFNFNIEDIVFPVAGITGILMAFINKESKWFSWVRLVFSVAFLFIALGFIKTGMEGFVNQTDLAYFNRYPLIIFLLLGIVLTAIVQSSLTTLALTLSALYANAITLQVAMAIVLGAEIGTTLKLFLASIGGSASKKRVALGNFLFNVITAAVILLLMRQVNHLITGVLQIHNSLIALVFFQSFVNLFCIMLFYPFLSLFGKFLATRFTDNSDESFYIRKTPVADAGLALEALENETKLLIGHVIDYSLQSFGEAPDTVQPDNTLQKRFNGKTIREKYVHIKQQHGEMHNYCLKLQNSTKDKPDAERLSQLTGAIRNTMYAAKSINDAQHDIAQMSNSSNDIKFDFYLRSKESIMNFCTQVQLLLNENEKGSPVESLTVIYHTIRTGYSENLRALYKNSVSKNVNEIEISTLINFNRELYTFFKSALYGLKDYLLSPAEAFYFDSLPGFAR